MKSRQLKGPMFIWDNAQWWGISYTIHGPLARYVKLRGAHAPGMPGMFSPPPRVSDPDMHHGTCVTHVPWCMPGSLTCGFLWFRWRGKRSRHSRRMRNPRFYVSVKRPIAGDTIRIPVPCHTVNVALQLSVGNVFDLLNFKCIITHDPVVLGKALLIQYGGFHYVLYIKSTNLLSWSSGLWSFISSEFNVFMYRMVWR